MFIFLYQQEKFWWLIRCNMDTGFRSLLYFNKNVAYLDKFCATEASSVFNSYRVTNPKVWKIRRGPWQKTHVSSVHTSTDIIREIEQRRHLSGNVWTKKSKNVASKSVPACTRRKPSLIQMIGGKGRRVNHLWTGSLACKPLDQCRSLWCLGDLLAL